MKAILFVILGIILFVYSFQPDGVRFSDIDSVTTADEYVECESTPEETVPLDVEENKLPQQETETEEDIWRKNSSKIISDVEAELEKKGWSIVDSFEGWGDWADWGIYVHALVELTDEEKDMFIYTVWGQWEGLNENYIDAVVRIAFSSDVPEGEIYKVFYHSMAGRYLAGDEFGGYTLEDVTEILSIDDERLLNCMYSY